MVFDLILLLAYAGTLLVPIRLILEGRWIRIAYLGLSMWFVLHLAWSAFRFGEEDLPPGGLWLVAAIVAVVIGNSLLVATNKSEQGSAPNPLPRP